MANSLLKTLHEFALPSELKENLKMFNKLLDDFKLTILTQAFSGFDAVQMRKILKKNQKVQDLEFIVTIGLTCGSNIAQIKSIINDTYQTLLVSWEKNYKLVSKDDGNPDAVTLARVIACFPEVTAIVLYNNKLPMPISYDSLETIAAEFPLAARHRAVAGVIPGFLNNNDLRDCLCVFMVPNLMNFEKFNLDNPHWQEKSKVTRARESLSFVVNSYQTRVVSASRRITIAICIEMVLPGPDGLTLSGVWRDTAKKCKKWLHNKYNFKVNEEMSFE